MDIFTVAMGLFHSGLSFISSIFGGGGGMSPKQEKILQRQIHDAYINQEKAEVEDKIATHRANIDFLKYQADVFQSAGFQKGSYSGPLFQAQNQRR